LSDDVRSQVNDRLGWQISDELKRTSASTAIGVEASLAGSSGFAPRAGAAGAIGPYVAGLITEGGKVVKDVVNISPSFLVGNVTAGTQDLAYGAPLRPAQNNPNRAQFSRH
jgi:hypothetical protein